MADNVTIQVIQQLVLNEVAAGKMFTAYDITLQARARGMQLRHGEGRDLVHQMFTSGRMGTDYARTTVNIGTDTPPLVYHRRSDDPNLYRSGSTNVVAQPPTTPSVPQAAAPAPTSKPPKTGLLSRIVEGIFGDSSAASASSTSTNPSAKPSTSSSGQAGPKVRAPITLNFDASDFLPINRSELLAAAKKLTLWGNPWFGRRDIIPPANDDRTKLIDRAMVTQGILTPAQLNEIHRIGAEMDHFRPTQLIVEAQARAAGADAVAADKARKEELKRVKKAEAEERRKQRRLEIELRKLNDIVFLGRSVSAQLHQRESDKQKLVANGLPVLETPAELAAALNLTVSKLRWLAYHNEVATRTHYVRFQIAKRSGGVRELSAPHATLAKAQRWILTEILNKLPVESSAHGFVAARSILSNALPHVNRAVVLNMDLENFFPSIGLARIRQVFKGLGYSPAVATVLALLCTESPRRAVTYAGQPYLVATGPRGLPQGACTSPALSNQVAKRLDRRLQGLATKLGLAYTRYADDLTLSSELSNLSVGYLMARVRHIAEDEGFVVNQAKTRVLRRNAAQSVTGLVVNDKPSVARKQLRQIRAILHQAQHTGLVAQNKSEHPNFRAWLQGMIAFIAMTRPELARQFAIQLQAVRD